MFEKRQQTTICVVALLLVADFVLFGYTPSYKRLRGLEARRAHQQSVIALGQAHGRKLAGLKEKMVELEGQVTGYEAKLPAARELGEFLHKVAGLMNEQNLTEQVMEPGEEAQTGRLHCIPVDMRCKGGLEQIFEFYRRLQGLERLVRIQQVRLVNDRDFAGEVTMQTKVVIYYGSGSKQG